MISAFEGLGGLARLQDAGTTSLSLEGRFDLAYNAAHALCFVAAPGQLNKAHVQFLAANLVRLATAAKRTPLDNDTHLDVAHAARQASLHMAPGG